MRAIGAVLIKPTLEFQYQLDAMPERVACRPAQHIEQSVPGSHALVTPKTVTLRGDLVNL